MYTSLCCVYGLVLIAMRKVTKSCMCVQEEWMIHSNSTISSVFNDIESVISFPDYISSVIYNNYIYKLLFRIISICKIKV